MADEVFPAALVDDGGGAVAVAGGAPRAVIGAIRQRTGDTSDYWESRAASKGANFRVEPGRVVPPLEHLLPHVDGETTVLMWGRAGGAMRSAGGAAGAAGGGGRASAGLAGILRENAVAAEVDAERLMIVGQRWMEAAVEPADVVLCANVLVAAGRCCAVSREARSARVAAVLRGAARDGG
ncbi:MAG: hypothetical protein U0841_10830 [Chloroflexia bacterium]